MEPGHNLLDGSGGGTGIQLFIAINNYKLKFNLSINSIGIQEASNQSVPLLELVLRQFLEARERLVQVVMVRNK